MDADEDRDAHWGRALPVGQGCTGRIAAKDPSRDKEQGHVKPTSWRARQEQKADQEWLHGRRRTREENGRRVLGTDPPTFLEQNIDSQHASTMLRTHGARGDVLEQGVGSGQGRTTPQAYPLGFPRASFPILHWHPCQLKLMLARPCACAPCPLQLKGPRPRLCGHLGVTHSILVVSRTCVRIPVVLAVLPRWLVQRRRHPMTRSASSPWVCLPPFPPVSWLASAVTTLLWLMEPRQG